MALEDKCWVPKGLRRITIGANEYFVSKVPDPSDPYAVYSREPDMNLLRFAEDFDMGHCRERVGDLRYMTLE